MPVYGIKVQPPPNSLNAAYRPIIFEVSGVATNGYITAPVMYCDIYFNGVFYKTVARTQWLRLNGVGTIDNTSDWQFDIQDVAQEYLRSIVPDPGLAIAVEGTSALIKAVCRFRASGLNTKGFTVPEGQVPTQATSSTPATSGDGYVSNTIYILNATLQHEDRQDVGQHLNAFKKGTWSSECYPLSHRPDGLKIREADSDYFPMIYGGASFPTGLNLRYRYRGQSTWRVAAISGIISCPIPSAILIGAARVGSTQTITITFDALPAVMSGMTILYRPKGSSGAFSSVTGGATSPRQLTGLALGKYDIQIISSGPCANNPILFSDIGVPDAPCTAVALATSAAIPDAVVDAEYSSVINLSGTAPYELSNITKPSWMSIAVDGSSIKLTGTPTATATGIAVSFRINNCYTASHVDVSETIDITQANNGIIISVSPGNMDIGFLPASCWKWSGSVTVKNAANVTVGTQSWSAHAAPDQEEILSIPNLPSGVYTISWNLVSVQNCSPVSSDVDYLEDSAAAVAKAKIDSATVTLSGSTTKQIQLRVNNS